MSGAMGSKQAAWTTTKMTTCGDSSRCASSRARGARWRSGPPVAPRRRKSCSRVPSPAPPPYARSDSTGRAAFEIAPTVSFTLLDEYRRTIFIGGRLQYNVTDWLGFGVWGAGGAGQSTRPDDEIDQTAPRNIFTAVNVNHTLNGTAVGPSNAAQSFTDQIGKLNWIVAPQVQFTPFRGKLSLFQKIFVDTDAYLHLGVGFVGYPGARGLRRRRAGPVHRPDSFALASQVKIAPTFGIGLNFYLDRLHVARRRVPRPPVLLEPVRASTRAARGTTGLPRREDRLAGRHVQVQPDDHDRDRLLAAGEAEASASERGPPSVASLAALALSASRSALRRSVARWRQRLADGLALLLGHRPAAREEAVDDAVLHADALLVDEAVEELGPIASGRPARAIAPTAWKRATSFTSEEGSARPSVRTFGPLCSSSADEDLDLRVDELGVLGVPARQPEEELLDVLLLVDAAPS